MPGQRKVPVLDLTEQIRHVLVVERQRPTQKRIQNHAARPNVDLGTGVGFAADYFWRRVVGASAAGFQELPCPHAVRQPKIRDLHVQVCVQEQVFRLQIPVHDVVQVAVLNPADDLLKKPASLRLPQPQFVHDVVEQLTAGHILHHHEKIRRRVQQLVQTNHVRVVQQLQDGDFSAHFFVHVHGLHLQLVHDFDRHLLSRQGMLGELHLAESADPQRPPQHIRTDGHHGPPPLRH
mmetsp:Transcript_25481/g.64197  ORF Transcript_25481/g.64197 Transcript_25481/m.64197 type:complete len:235 (-) Transcript_25481:648-1352(-)